MVGVGMKLKFITEKVFKCAIADDAKNTMRR